MIRYTIEYNIIFQKSVLVTLKRRKLLSKNRTKQTTFKFAFQIKHQCQSRVGDLRVESSTEMDRRHNYVFDLSHYISMKAITSRNVLRIRNWRTLLHMCRTDAACALTVWQHFGRHLESVTLTRKFVFVNRCIFTWRIYLSNFIPIRFGQTEHWASLKRFNPTRTTAR